MFRTEKELGPRLNKVPDQPMKQESLKQITGEYIKEKIKYKRIITVNLMTVQEDNKENKYFQLNESNENQRFHWDLIEKKGEKK